MGGREYGHNAFQGKGIFMDGWGAGPYVLTAGGKTFHFEDSDRFGPNWLKANGEPRDEFIPEKSPFWAAWKRWVAEGRRAVKGKKNRLYCVVSDGRRKKS